MNKKANIKESIKSILIVVLTLSTILLLYIFWADVELTKFSFSDIDLGFSNEDEERINFVEGVAVPSEMIIGTGQGDYIVKNETKALYGNVNNPSSFVSSILEFEQSEELFVEEISVDQYDEAYSYKSVKAVFDYILPLGDYYKFKNGSGFAGVEEINNLSEVGFSEVAKDSLLVKDATQNKYFRVVKSSESNWLSSFFESNDFSNEAFYYPMSAFLGEEVSQDVLLPMYMESDMTQREMFCNRDPAGDALQAKSFFGNTFDFVRKIQESGGKVIYMYGYGETVLILNEDGSIEYKTESVGTQNLNYFEAMDLALQFYDNHQPITTISGIQPEIRLEKVKVDNTGRKTYHFEFGYNVESENIFFSEGTPVVIEVSGGMVTYYYIKKPIISGKEDKEKTEVFSAVNTIAANYENISLLLHEELSMEEVAQKISSVKSGYLAHESSLLPVWQIKVKGIDKPLYFDLYTSEQYGLD